MAQQRNLLVLTLSLPSLLVLAQAPIVPLWSHTWSHGQDAFPVPIPAAADNHVAVDPITGLVHVSIDAGPNGSIMHGDQVYTFNPSGQDLSPTPAPYIGPLMPSKGDPFISEGTADLAAYDGTVWALRAVNRLGLLSTAGTIVALRTDGSRTQTSLGGSEGRGHLVADAAGAVAVRSLNQPDAGLHAVDAAGWIGYSVPHPGTGLPSDACLLGGTIYTIRNGLVTPSDRTTGNAGASWPAFTGTHPAQIAAHGGLLFYAYADNGGNCTWGAKTLSGQDVWQRTAPLGAHVEELQVDAFGRPWFIGNAVEGGGSPVLVVTASDGSAHDRFTYGARMNDLALGDGQAYITGQVEAGGTSTYLIAMGTDLTTDAPALEAAQAITVYPQPATDQLTLGNAGRIVRGRILDVNGKAVRASFIGSTVDVSRLSEGAYFLEAETERGLFTRRFVVAR